MIDNIFTALVRQKTSGIILEFVLWCVACFTALMSVIALALGKGQVTWILMLVFSIGLAVLMVFRLKAVIMLYSVGVFYFITLLTQYISFSIVFSEGEHLSPLNIILFILILLLAAAILVCGSIHFFSRINLGNITAILVMVDSGLIVLLNILMYACEYLGDDYGANTYHRVYMNRYGYWIGTISFWMIIAVTAVYFACFFWGPIDKKKGKLPWNSGTVGGAAPYLVGICGTFGGQTIQLRGQTLTIGSGEGVNVYIPDPHVSKMHGAIRFNPSSGYYEILDQSTNGIWLSNGSSIQKGVYTSVQRGSVICIGSAAQQFRLM